MTQVRTALGTADEAAEVTTAYTPNGLVQTVTDGENNKTTYEYDGHDRLAKTYYPMPSPKGAGTSNGADYEQATYEILAGGTRTSGLVTAVRNRAGQSIGFGHDALGRTISKDLPGAEPDVSYGYDLLGRRISASQAGAAFTFAYDALGRQRSETGPRGTVSSDFDLAGRRIRIVYPDGFWVDQDYLVTGEIWKIRENGAASGIGVLATFGYDDLGRRTSLTRGNGTVTAYGYDAVSRLSALSQDLGGTAYDLTLGFAYNPASQIVASTRSNPGSGPGQADAYAWLGHGGGTTASAANGLNQISVHGGAAVGHDAAGNLALDPTIGKTYGYSSENLLSSVGLGGGVTGTLSYDPLMRLSEAGVNQKTRIVHDGGQRIAEYYGTANAPMARFVNGPGLDEPLVEYQGAGLATRRWLHADERGSIVARSDDSGNLANVNTFDEQGLIGPTNAGRFHFAGQPYETLPDLYYSRARMRNPRLGRFNQTDPIGYGGGINLYAYANGDPVNLIDPAGLSPKSPRTICTGTRIASGCGAGGIASGLSGFSTAGVGGQYATGEASLSRLGVNTSGMSGGEMRALAAEFLGYGEWALATSAPRDAVLLWGLGETGFTAVTVAAEAFGSNFSPTLRAIWNDDDVRSEMRRAWILSNPYGEKSSKNEHGFWIGQRESDYFSYGIQKGQGPNIWAHSFRPSGANIFFHTHPFTVADGYIAGLSGGDFGLARHNAMVISYGHRARFDEFDYRKGR